MIFKSSQIRHVARAAALLLIACASTFSVEAAMLTINPSTGVEQTGQPFTVSVSVSGLDPLDDLYTYSFDLAFNSADFKVLAANDGTIFDYGGNTGVYVDGAIDNTHGFVANQGGLDINQGFNGTGGLLGSFTFEALRPFASTTIKVQNVSLSTFAAASNLQPPDINPGTLPFATLSASRTAAPEPGTGVLVGLVVAAGALIHRAKKRRIARSNNPLLTA